MDYNGLVAVRKLLKRANYTVDVYNTADGCGAKYPLRIIDPVMPESRANYVRLGQHIYFSQQVEGNPPREDVWEVETYMRRMTILCDVICQCRKYDYNIGLIRFVKNGKRMESIFEVIDEELSNEEEQMESVLLFLLTEIKFGEDLKNFEEVRDTAVKYKITEGFDLLLRKFLSM